MQPLNPENPRLIQRFEKLYYNDGREMRVVDVVRGPDSLISGNGI